MYENYKIYGPYLNKGRLRIIIVHSITGEKHTVSYPKFLIENYLNRYLEENETVDHIDGNPLNNDISNLQVLKRNIHCSLDALRNKDVIVKCSYCGKEFLIEGNKIYNRNRLDRHQSGYFCSRQCSGKYGKEIQLKKKSHIIKERIKPSKYKVKSAQLETIEVEAG